MSDLRRLLGDDRYDKAIIKATKRALLNYPNLPISIVQHEALAGQALAAVLPDLLAQAWDEGQHAADEAGWLPSYIREAMEVDNPYREGADRG